jgi:hypothetical protein
MNETKLDQQTVYRKVRHAVRLTQENKYEEALLLFEMYMPLLSSHNEDEKRLLTLASSYCGLCVAEVKHHLSDISRPVSDSNRPIRGSARSWTRSGGAGRP